MALSVFRLPDLGEGLTEADVVEWYVAEGEAVALDQPVVALESAKAVVDIPSPVAGRVRRYCARPGETVATGAPLVECEVKGGGRAGAADAVDAAGPGASGGSGKPPAPVGPSDGSPASAGADGCPPVVRSHGRSTPGGRNECSTPADSDGLLPPTGSGKRSARAGSDGPLPLVTAAGHSASTEPEVRLAPPGTERIDAMPAARALGVDLASMAGTGPGGRRGRGGGGKAVRGRSRATVGDVRYTLCGVSGRACPPARSSVAGHRSSARGEAPELKSSTSRREASHRTGRVR